MSPRWGDFKARGDLCSEGGAQSAYCTGRDIDFADHVVVGIRDIEFAAHQKLHQTAS